MSLSHCFVLFWQAITKNRGKKSAAMVLVSIYISHSSAEEKINEPFIIDNNQWLKFPLSRSELWSRERPAHISGLITHGAGAGNWLHNSKLTLMRKHKHQSFLKDMVLIGHLSCTKWHTLFTRFDFWEVFELAGHLHWVLQLCTM